MSCPHDQDLFYEDLLKDARNQTLVTSEDAKRAVSKWQDIGKHNGILYALLLVSLITLVLYAFSKKENKNSKITYFAIVIIVWMFYSAFMQVKEYYRLKLETPCTESKQVSIFFPFDLSNPLNTTTSFLYSLTTLLLTFFCNIIQAFLIFLILYITFRAHLFYHRNAFLVEMIKKPIVFILLCASLVTAITLYWIYIRCKDPKEYWNKNKPQVIICAICAFLALIFLVVVFQFFTDIHFLVGHIDKALIHLLPFLNHSSVFSNFDITQSAKRYGLAILLIFIIAAIYGWAFLPTLNIAKFCDSPDTSYDKFTTRFTSGLEVLGAGFITAVVFLWLKHPNSE